VKRSWFLLVLTGVLAGGDLARAEWGEFFEAEVPFHATTLDAREAAPGNLTPRAIVLHVGKGFHVAFDPDLLRVALVWRENEAGEFLTPVGMAPGSYSLDTAGKKAPGGQGKLPEPVGEIVLANGLYPGWVLPGKLAPWVDPRTRPVDEEEPGRGPLRVEGFRFGGLKLAAGKPVTIEYEAGGVPVVEHYEFRTAATGKFELVRIIRVKGKDSPRGLAYVEGPGEVRHVSGSGEYVTSLAVAESAGRGGLHPDWDESVEVRDIEVLRDKAYRIEALSPPRDNPWKRNVRLSGIDFFADGRAAFTTFDGDVWLVEGLDGPRQHWRRHAAGLNEPMGVQIVDEEIYVFDRTTIWRLHDETGDGVADRYENFCNLVAQTAETREFPTGFLKRPGGGFVLSKGGQVGTSRGHYNGSVITVAADGQSFEVLGRGLRMPFIGVDPRTGEITASDQQGHWVPTTPIHRVRKGSHFGFLPTILEDATHEQPVTEPMLWIPHFSNQSGASQITIYDSRFGPLAGKLLHLGYNRPEIHCLFPDGNQGASASVWDEFDGGVLKAARNPKDGQLYVCGFKIWGTVGEKWSSLFRVRYTGNGTLEAPVEVRSERRGVLLRFSEPVEPAIAAVRTNYEVDRWNYRRSSRYGSGHYKLDGSPGQETLPVSSVKVSKDRRAVFLGVPDMKPVEQIRVTYRLPFASQSEWPEIRAAYLTVKRLRDLDLEAEGFADGTVKLEPPPAAETESSGTVSVKEGRRVYHAYGCVACHSLDGTQAEKVGPTWLGLYGSRRRFVDGTYVKKADDVYLRESILNPTRRVTEAYDGEGVGMPPYLGVLKEHEVDSLILLMKSLSKNGK